MGLVSQICPSKKLTNPIVNSKMHISATKKDITTIPFYHKLAWTYSKGLYSWITLYTLHSRNKM